MEHSNRKLVNILISINTMLERSHVLFMLGCRHMSQNLLICHHIDFQLRYISSIRLSVYHISYIPIVNPVTLANLAREASSDKIVFFLTLFKPGGGQHHVQKFILQILYNSGGCSAI